LIPAVTETVICDVPVKYYICDTCGNKVRHKLIECIGCGKHSCCGHKDILEFEVGVRGDEDTYGGTTPQSDDYRIAWFYLCPECKKVPPENIKKLLDLTSALERINTLRNKTTNNIIDEIERLSYEYD